MYSNTREQSNKTSGTRQKTESETGERRFEARALCAHKTLTPRFTDIFTDFEKKKKTRLFCRLGLMQLAMSTAIPALLETEGFLSSSYPLPLAEAILNLFSELLS